METLIQLTLAALLGWLVGLDREHRRKEAVLRIYTKDKFFSK